MPVQLVAMPSRRLAHAALISQSSGIGNPSLVVRLSTADLLRFLQLLVLLSFTTALPALASDSATRSVMSDSTTNAVPAAPSASVCECPAKTVNNGADANAQAEIYAPLSPHCKFNLFLRQTYSPYTFVSAGFQATLAQANDQWPHYGGGMAGYGKRFGATLADTESRRFIQTFALSTILHQDPRYFPSEKNKLLARAWYAASRVIIGRSDDGRSSFNSPEFLGTLFASSLQNAYYPRHDRNFADTIGRFGAALSSDAATYLLREFTPDIKRIFQRHTPTKIKNIERKLPIPDEDKL